MRARDSQPLAASTPDVDFYDATYRGFSEALYQEIRKEVWVDEFGQNGWITANEQDRFIEWLALRPGQRLLDVACGSGGPALRIVERTGAAVVGVDIHADGIKAGQQAALQRGLTDRACFELLDARKPLPFGDASFDAVICIDAINHLADRPRVLRDWSRVLKAEGRLLFTDPAVVTGALTNEEIAIRSSIGFFMFVGSDTDERMIADAGLRLLGKADLSEALAEIGSKWHAARQKRAAELERVESAVTFEGQQRFLEVAARVARERRLSRFAYLACKGRSA